jgi:orotidine-5'-phosphate decarboxylase
MRFRERLEETWERTGSLLCVGLDPEPGRLPVDDIVAFNRAVIAATSDLVCAYKPNVAFYERLGADGFGILKATIEAIPEGVLTIVDAKRGDVSHTARAYAEALFDALGADAVTVNPYLGADSVQPFVERPDRGAFVVCRTSNPGARDLQDLVIESPDGPRPLYEVVALAARTWSRHENIGLVAGATYLEEMARLRALCPELPILVPGVGAQGGDVRAAVRAGMDDRGLGIIITASRSVLYAGSGPQFADAVREAALRLRQEIDAARGVRTEQA